jgi:hypothetical protein
MRAISKEMKILAPASLFLLTGMLFSLLSKRLISNALLFYITAIYFLIFGVYWILKDKELTMIGKLIWLLIVLLFNILGVICLVVWRNMKEKI